jgi:peroxiredoxin
MHRRFLFGVLGCVCLSAASIPLLSAQSAHQAAPTFNLVVPPFGDSELTAMLDQLDSRVARSKGAADFRFTLWDFARRVQTGRLSQSQESQVLQHLAGLSDTRPADAGAVNSARRMVSALTVGKVAPDIAGSDLDGASMSLSDYRGKVTVVMFSGDWCGICRVQYPYERLMLELYKNWPFALVGVDSSTSLARAKQVKHDERLTFRSWWDGGAAKNTEGPIATSWNVAGWPTVYVLDQHGVIRFVDVREEDLLKAVRLLLAEMQH